MKLIDELWEDYAWVSHWKPDGTGVNMMDHEPFKQAIIEALERQRRGCEVAYVKEEVRCSNLTRVAMNAVDERDIRFTHAKRIDAILNAPPAEKEKPVIDSWEKACETPFDPPAGEDE